jgi:uncharacterized protein YajQ (UPF0234 family)
LEEDDKNGKNERTQWLDLFSVWIGDIYKISQEGQMAKEKRVLAILMPPVYNIDSHVFRGRFAMPSFDIVCEVDLQEVDNAVNQAAKDVETRYDFRSGKSSVTFDRNQQTIKVIADDDMKLRAIHQILESKLAKRGVDLRSLKFNDPEQASGNLLRQEIGLVSGLSKDDAKKVTKVIKDTKIKVSAQIQDDQVRVTGKKIDDLQEVIAALKQSSLGLPIQYINMRS